MTELREQLLSARDEHRSARYPGNLASELLPPAPVAPPVRPCGVRTSAVRLAGVALAAAAAVALVVVRPAERMTHPRPEGGPLHVAPPPSVVNAARPSDAQGWWFAPDLTFASAAAERVKTVASRVQMRVTSPYRDLRMPSMPEWPALGWPDWVREGDTDAESREDGKASPQAGPSTQQSV